VILIIQSSLGTFGFDVVFFGIVINLNDLLIITAPRL